MATYHQIGHDSKNLIFEPNLNKFSGAILSPINYAELETSEIITTMKISDFEFIFDPQLYYPEFERGELPTWTYFPKDVDTADKSSIQWWDNIIEELCNISGKLKLDCICSPAIVPRLYNPDYYRLSIEVATKLQNKIHNTNIMQTVLVRISELADKDNCKMIASIISSSKIRRIYLILITEFEPRDEISDLDCIQGVMTFINLLESAGFRILIGYSSSDIILWKAAGVSDCATGKFFNLRRFNDSRFKPKKQGGGQTYYWFEENLFSFLRVGDFARLSKLGLFSPNHKTNPFSLAIIQQMKTDPAKAWLALSWRQFLYWFSEFEEKLTGKTIEPLELLKGAEKRWSLINGNHIKLEEPDNNGSWITSWRKSIEKFFVT